MDYTNNPRVSFDQQGNMYVDGVIVKVREVVFEDKKSMNIAYRDLKNSFDLGAVSAEEFYSELESLRDYYLEDGSAAWWKYTRQILSYEAKLIDEKQRLEEQARQQEMDRRMNGLSALYSLGEISAEQYYSGLEAVRDEFLQRDSDQWLDYTRSLGEFYSSALKDAKESSGRLADKLMGSIMHHYTIKNAEGQVVDSFYRLISPDSKDAADFLNGYSYLAQSGAPDFVLSDYLSRTPEDAEQVLRLFRELGEGLPGYFEEISRTRAGIVSMTDGLFGVNQLQSIVTSIVDAIKESPSVSGVDITQNFYGNSLSPAEISRETTNALKLQGVDL